MPRRRSTALHFRSSYALSACNLSGRFLGLPQGRLTELDGIDQLVKHQRVVSVSSGEHERQRDTLVVHDQVMFRPHLAAIGWVRSHFRAAFFAGTAAESRLACSQAIWSASRSLARSSWWSRCQTPACCHSRSRRKLVIPLPQSISLGASPRDAATLHEEDACQHPRLSRGCRPGKREWRGLSGGNKGSITDHRSSSSRGLAIISLPTRWLPHYISAVHQSTSHFVRGSKATAGPCDSRCRLHKCPTLGKAMADRATAPDIFCVCQPKPAPDVLTKNSATLGNINSNSPSVADVHTYGIFSDLARSVFFSSWISHNRI